MTSLLRLHPWLATGPAAWLVSREVHPGVAREAWAKGLPATLRAGIHFDAVHVSAALVESRVESRERGAVEAWFRDAGITAAVIVSRLRDRYTALVSPDTAAGWDVAHTHCLGATRHTPYLAVPVPTRRRPPGAFWLLPAPDDDGMLCAAERLRELLGGAAAR
ncbi:hypothetical protein [Streptomyces mobaraensis]|uniref:Uncharacterized protein n=1 Tax=Streptomyces mobaraensis TaxID=35621 RepID=A0A5N5W3T5_STRMB|nr:hypothetical protein [Streptomyces mobaraensis]KAB7836438.1 hypothetical protein FRZ00_25275 [Streptomyces mobaraensis]